MILITAPAIFQSMLRRPCKSHLQGKELLGIYIIYIRNMLLRSEMFEWTISYHILAWTGIYMAFVLNTGPR